MRTEKEKLANEKQIQRLCSVEPIIVEGKTHEQWKDEIRIKFKRLMNDECYEPSDFIAEVANSLYAAQQGSIEPKTLSKYKGTIAKEYG